MASPRGSVIQQMKKRKKTNNLQTITEAFKKRKSKETTDSTEKVTSEMKGACPECEQHAADVDLFKGDAEEAQEEFDALFNDSLIVASDSKAIDSNELPQYKVTAFTVYDKHFHVCPFDSGLIEKNKELRFSGVLKSICCDDPSPEGGVLARGLGPIVSWWTTGFDGGDRVIVGFTTSCAEYILMNPSEQYTTIMNSVLVKSHISKTVIEYLIENQDASYEDLLSKIESRVPVGGLQYSEEVLHRHAQFIIDQIQSFDAAVGDGNTPLLATPFSRTLARLTGVVLGYNRGRLTHQHVAGKPSTVKNNWLMPLVEDLLKSLFPVEDDTLAQVTLPSRKSRCGTCEFCQAPDCGRCIFCRNMKKFGGNGRWKQCCIGRRCPNRTIREAEENSSEPDHLKDSISSELILENQPFCISRSFFCPPGGGGGHSKVGDWVVKETTSFVGDFRKYTEVQFGDGCLKCGDFVLIRPYDGDSTPDYLADIGYFYEEPKSLKKIAHVRWFCRGTDTFLGNMADKQEIFFIVDDCGDVPLEAIRALCTVTFPTFDSMTKTEMADFICKRSYDLVSGSFSDLPREFYTSSSSKGSCSVCDKRNESELNNLVHTSSQRIEDEDVHTEVTWKGATYRVRDCVYLIPGSGKIKPEAGRPELGDPDASFDLSKVKLEQSLSDVLPNEVKVKGEIPESEIYTESYRKKGCVPSASVVQPFRVALIKSIKLVDGLPSFRLNLFYRPEETGLVNEHPFYRFEYSLLYYSSHEIYVDSSDICGHCFVVYLENISEDLTDFISKGPDRFYFNEAYDVDKKQFCEPPEEAKTLGRTSKGRGRKGTRRVQLLEVLPLPEYLSLQVRLKTLDVYSDCGGLVTGLCEAGLCCPEWAVVQCPVSAATYRKNFPDCSVLNNDPACILEKLRDEAVTPSGNFLPRKGFVDLICGSPPLTGLKGMNKMTQRDYTTLRNSALTTFLSYCGLLMPNVVMLFMERKATYYKEGAILKFIVRCLLDMNYQVTFGILQDGDFGIPQNCKRLLIMALSMDENMASFPRPFHAFTSSSAQLSIFIDKRKFLQHKDLSCLAPYRRLTLFDAISDLPPLSSGDRRNEIFYKGEPKLVFQKMARMSEKEECEDQETLQDHVCKKMTPLVEARIANIPVLPGADWRDLPNIDIQLKDGTYARTLYYSHLDSATGLMRGVCPCAEGGKCDPSAYQDNTLIPWCLVHTGNRNHHWKGRYGRLSWEGYFPETIDNPEPMGRVGTVLHPDQNRVISVRECARVNGYKDDYRFQGTILERYRQIGRSVPPPVARAVGRELVKCLLVKELRLM